mmetsp:Transcript_53530/g.125879  ORF Transcript_53530/g.125879 Transcript_53530/m.125879 type:complete len:268 (-) Transcript_53530:181-984(-)
MKSGIAVRFIKQTVFISSPRSGLLWLFPSALWTRRLALSRRFARLAPRCISTTWLIGLGPLLLGAFDGDCAGGDVSFELFCPRHVVDPVLVLGLCHGLVLRQGRFRTLLELARQVLSHRCLAHLLLDRGHRLLRLLLQNPAQMFGEAHHHLVEVGQQLSGVEGELGGERVDVAMLQTNREENGGLCERNGDIDAFSEEETGEDGNEVCDDVVVDEVLRIRLETTEVERCEVHADLGRGERLYVGGLCLVTPQLDGVEHGERQRQRER